VIEVMERCDQQIRRCLDAMPASPGARGEGEGGGRDGLGADPPPRPSGRFLQLGKTIAHCRVMVVNAVPPVLHLAGAQKTSLICFRPLLPSRTLTP